MVLLSRVRYPSQSGTAVRRDFVEFPSQIYEHWMSMPETLRTLRRPLRDRRSRYRRICCAACLRRAISIRALRRVEYTAAALLDLAFHTPSAPETIDVAGVRARISWPRSACRGRSASAIARRISSICLPAAAMPRATTPISGPRCSTPTASRRSPRPETSSTRPWRRGSRPSTAAGDTRDPMELYVAFRGREPRIEALLKHRGLAAAAAE